MREAFEYEAAHVVGALSMPLSTFDVHALPASTPIILMCLHGSRSTQLMQSLHKARPELTLSCLTGGMTAWEGNNLPVMHGAQAMPLDRQVHLGVSLIIFTGVIGGVWVHPAFFGLCALAGGGLLLHALTGFCGMGLLLAKMPWNKRD